MDHRKLRLKELRKECRKQRGKYFTGWKVVAICLLVLAIIFTALWVLATPEVSGMLLPNSLDGQVMTYLENLTGISLAQMLLEYALVLTTFTIGLWALFLLTLIPWSNGKKKWKKSEAYLDYRTMRNTLRQEKRME